MVNATIEVEQEAPVLITVREAERLCTLKRNQGYRYAATVWAPFVVKMGNGEKSAIRINRRKLLEWAGEQAA